MYDVDMTTDTKFHTVVSPEADAQIDTLGEHAIDALGFTADVIPNIVRRDAISKAATPMGTVFVFQVPNTPVVVTCLNGHNERGDRVMLVLGFGKVEV